MLKDLAAFWGIPAYTMKGVHQELIKSRQPTKFIRRARIMQGQSELTELTREDLKDADNKVREAWKVIMAMNNQIQIAKSKGLRGRYQIYKGKRKWEKYGIFESTDHTKRALEAYQEGRDLKTDFEPPAIAAKQHNSPGDHLHTTEHDQQKQASTKRQKQEEKA